MENKISCNVNRLKIIDPNKFSDGGSFSNVPVNNEDLTISVSLETFKKGRTLLTATDDKSGNTRKSTDTINVTFMEGSDVNGKKVLTTNYTDLTTVFDDNSVDSAGETLGITNINIDFNSQQAPMVTIDFIDVRGSAIFQNEANITNGKNKYSTFFQLPYPLFKLTVKGYYGKPVQYCLHLTKFNSRFNSQTGNFEITANFIGYTYAMLSDMLVGYLKAIPYTKKGEEIYTRINEERTKNGLTPIINLDDLMILISEINENIKKLPADDVDSAEINNTEEKLNQLDVIESLVNVLGSKLDDRGTNTQKYEYIIYSTKDKDSKAIISDFTKDMLPRIKDFNDNNLVQIDEKLFEMKNYYPQQSINILNKTLDDSPSKNNSFAFLVLDYINKQNNLGFASDDTIFDVWILTDIYKAINEAKASLTTNQKNAKINLGITIKEKIQSRLGFVPTVRNILEIFTTAVEVFMEAIYNVSVSAENDTKKKRNPQLKQKFRNNLNTSDLKNPEANIYPWPDYREIKTSGYTETYLGAKNVLENPLDVDEIEFIEDLLLAFIKAAQQTDAANSILTNDETNWWPINPLDTRLFGITDSPYKRIGRNGLSGYEEIARLMLIRGMAFLGNNTYLTQNELEGMAEIEAMSIIDNIPDEQLKRALSTVSVSTLSTLTGKINDKERNIVTLTSADNYYYTYFPTGSTLESFKILPIDEGFQGNWSQDANGVWSYDASQNESSNFLTNYNNNITNTIKKEDGGMYAKFFTLDAYNEFSNLSLLNKPDTVDTTNKLILEKLQTPTLTNPKAAGFNYFGGIYGVQDFSVMDFGNTSYPKLPLKYLFFAANSHFGVSENNQVNYYTTNKFDWVNGNTGHTVYFNENFGRDYDSANECSDGISRYNKIGDNYQNLDELDLNKHSYPFVEMGYFIPDNSFIFNMGNEASTEAFSLFGSKWYYAQSKSAYPMYAKALLFLNTLPWNGEPFEKDEIKHLFDIRTGFIHMPKLWAAYVGGLLWRADSSLPIIENGFIIGGGSGANDPIIWTHNNKVLSPYEEGKAFSEFVAPTKTQNILKLFARRTETANIYSSLNKTLLYLPEQVKNEFKKVFFNFVHSDSVTIGPVSKPSYDFNKLNDLSKIVNGDLADFETKVAPIYNAINANNTSARYGYIPTSIITNNLINIDKYFSVTPITDAKYMVVEHFGLEYKQTAKTAGSPANIILSMIEEELVMANNDYHIWEKAVNSTQLYYPIYTSQNTFNTYFNKVLDVLKQKMNSTTAITDRKQKEQNIFGTSDEDAIKLQLYRTCKNIYDKWLGGITDSKNIIFNCGKTRNSIDYGLAKKYRNSNTPTLIDSFRFVDRAFNDIGDKLYINPTPVNDYLLNSPNTSVYDVLGQLLASNNFNFLALPAFINYNDEQVLSSMFEPYNSNELKLNDETCGPSFVCVYVGQTSKHLDFANSEYPNDGIDFQCVEGKPSTNIPDDFVGTSNDYENDIAVFSVNYSQQNQNIFKDITLDQSEFSETDESLKISDDIANKGAETNITLGGQNIYNVYSVRSYKAEVEMLGNAMIQPMMHFQLNNIPMFHGGYLITRVKHNIKPNHMSTVFSGVRIRYPKTELLSGSDFYMNMINSIDLTAAGNVVSTSAGVPPIVNTIINNGGVPSNIDAGNISLTAIPQVDGIRSQIATNTFKNRMITEAIEPLKQMLIDWVDWMKNTAGFSGYVVKGNRYYAEITSAYRSYQDQANSGKNATKGISNHQWGIAIDFQMAKKDGTLIKNEQNLENFKITNNPALEWLLNNSWKYGFVIPYGMRDGIGNYNEFWHFEYHGKAAICLIKNNPITYGGHVVKNITVQKDIVSNPKGKDGNRDVYNGCDYIYLKINQGTNDGGQIPTKDIYTQLKKQLGYTDEAIAGIMGNMYQESRFKPTSENSSDGGYGLVQWTNERKPKFLKYMSDNSLDKTSYINQIGYINHELTNTFKYTGKNLLTNKDASNSAKIFYVTYEGGSLGTKNFTESQVNARLTELNAVDTTYDKRISFANQFYKMIKNNNFKFPKE